MRLDARQFDLLAIAIFVAMLAHINHLPLWLSGAFSIVLGLRWLQRRRRGQWGPAPVWVRLPLTLALPAVVIAEFGNLFGREPGSVLAVGMLVLKFTESERARDARAAVTFGCFVLMAALLFDQGLVMTVLISIGLLPQILVLRSLEPRGGGLAAPATLAELRGGLPYVTISVLAAAPLALVMFLFLPRLAEPLWGAPSSDRGRTGMSDTMRPGGLTELLVDDSPAFRASFASGTPPSSAQLYWRGLVLWRFDGSTWTHLPSVSLPDDDPGLRIISEPLRYELTMEPTQQGWVFALDLPLAAPPETRRNADFSIISEKPIVTLTQYHLTSAPVYRLTAPLTRRQRTLGLALPQGFNPRTLALAQQWRERYGDDERRIVDAALAMYSAEFSYTLNAPPLGRDSMDDFLFETKSGYCEHFSSSFTVLMRAAGIPARVVVGYQGGYWNALGNYVVVRQSDAHAWSEIWQEGAGWVRVDPTAAVQPARVDRGSRASTPDEMPWYRAEWLLSLRNQWDLVNQLWNHMVVQFSALQQKNLLTSFGIDKAEWRQLAIALTVLGGLLLAAGMAWALRRDRDPGDAVDRAYRRLGRRLARAGLQRDDAEGPAAYLDRLRARFPQAAAEIENVFARYVTLRYASHHPEPTAVREFLRAVAAVRVRDA